MSAWWTVARSIAARPVTDVRVMGTGSVRASFSLVLVGPSQCSAAGRSTSPSISIRREKGAAHRRAARFATMSEHRLDVVRRTRDYAQDFTDRCLLFQPLARLVEQPDVVDRNRRLPREGFDQRDLVGCEQARLAAVKKMPP